MFGSAPSYEHLRVFDYMCYPNTAATVPHKLSPRSTQCVFLGYSTDHKSYRCLDLLTNCLIVSRHVIFDEDIFPLAASPSLTDLNFLCESDPTISPIRTHLTTTGTSTPEPRQPAPEIPPGFEPPVAPLPARQFLKDFCPRRLPRLRHLPSQMAHHPVHGRPHRLSTSGGRWELVPQGHMVPPELPCVGRWELVPRDTCRLRSCLELGGGRRCCPELRGGSRSRGDTWRPRSCPTLGGGRRGHGDTWCPRSCPEPGGGRRNRGDT
jgi:hypothetical protein